MNRSWLRYVLIAAAILLLLRLAPVITRLGQGLLNGLRAYWWIILPALLLAWIIWRLRRRRRVRVLR